jgi:hypothetical protein
MQNITTAAPVITKKIGNTIYKIQIHFNETSKDNFNDKLLRVIKNDMAKSLNSKTA